MWCCTRLAPFLGMLRGDFLLTTRGRSSDQKTQRLGVALATPHFCLDAGRRFGRSCRALAGYFFKREFIILFSVILLMLLATLLFEILLRMILFGALAGKFVDTLALNLELVMNIRGVRPGGMH